MAESRFDQAAATWDENPGRIALARAIVAAILARAPVRAEMTAVDFGCGTGLVSLGLAERARRVIGIDSSAGMLNVLNEKLQKAGIRNVETMLDLETAPAPDIQADLVASAMTLHHLLDVPAMLRKLASMLAPGGYLALADLVTEDGSFHGDMTGVRHLGFDPEWVAEMLHGLGFEEINSSIAYIIDRGEKQYPVFLVSGKSQDKSAHRRP